MLACHRFLNIENPQILEDLNNYAPVLFDAFDFNWFVCLAPHAAVNEQIARAHGLDGMTKTRLHCIITFRHVC
jgi:hypothetical protein